jgi:hypothetical protein
MIVLFLRRVHFGLLAAVGRFELLAEAVPAMVAEFEGVGSSAVAGVLVHDRPLS